MRKRETLGWEAACGCGTSARRPGFVLDPFSGAGTTALCAARLGHGAVGIDLSTDYLEMAAQRLRDTGAKCLDTDGSRLEFCETEVSLG
jgi:tRNA G10  N-methylase Trm11